MNPRHFHLGAAAILGVVAAYTAVLGLWLPASFLLAGAVVALAHWKAVKAGIIENE